MKYYLSYLICLAACHVLPMVLAAQNGQYFQVPHDPDKQFDADRPPRLVDDVKDPDMVKLKDLQEKFFAIASNTSLGREFNGFYDIIELLNSQAGAQLGSILGQGLVIGYGKLNSFELLSEFWDDFQYKLPHGLSAALVDYTDFARSIDISLIPMTLDLLFQKDNLGNSLAQMPIGQLIDMVQPEASKYGIDIRSFVNGIIGKGDSTFPDLLQNTMKNINLQSVVNTLTKFMPKEFTSQSTDLARSTKAAELEKTLQLFKPLIANTLKSNGIDLEADAVIQVLIPFVGAAGEYINNLYGGSGGGLDLTMLAPLIGMLSAGNGKNSNPLALFASLLGNADTQSDNGMANMLKIASQFMGGDGKKTDGNKKTGGFDLSSVMELVGQLSGGAGGIDASGMLKTAASMFSNKKNGSDGGQDVLGLLGKITKGESIDPGDLLQTAASLMQGTKPKKEKKPKETVENNITAASAELVTPKGGSSLINVLRPLILALKDDTRIREKITKAVTQLKLSLQKNNVNFDSIESFLLSVSGLKELPSNINMGVINFIFSLSYMQLMDFVSRLGNADMRLTTVSQFSSEAAKVVSMFASPDFDRELNQAFRNVTVVLQFLGIRGVTVDNFPDKIRVPVQTFLKMSSIDLDIEPLLKPTKTFIKTAIQWKTDATQYIRNLPKQKLLAVVSKSLDRDVLVPIYEIWRAHDSSKNTPECLPRAICDAIDKMETSPNYSALRVASGRIASFVFAVMQENMNVDPLAIGDILLTSFSKYEDCETTYPVTCPPPVVVDKQASDAEKKHIEL